MELAGKSYDKITEFCAFPMFASFNERDMLLLILSLR